MLHSLDLSRPRQVPDIWEAVSEKSYETAKRPMPLNCVKTPFPADLSVSGASLVYAGYPYDPFRTNSDPQ
jgi:hypothetical protein